MMRVFRLTFCFFIGYTVEGEKIKTLIFFGKREYLKLLYSLKDETLIILWRVRRLKH